jgi:hypothetical protein
MTELAVPSAAPSSLVRTARDLSDVDPLASRLAHWLDTVFRVPGTKIRFGLDPILGALAPGLGDAVTGGLGTYLFFVALRRGVPLGVIARMALNVLIDTVVGSVPVVGDVFDVAWKSNAKNLELIRRHAGRRGPPGIVDYAIVLGASALVLGTALAPLILAAIFGVGLWAVVTGPGT